jgi:N-methylhydantoinase A
MSWQITADIREMFVELAATDGNELFHIRTTNRKDLLVSGFSEALAQLSASFNAQDATLSLTTDLDRITMRECWSLESVAFLTTEGFQNLLEIGDQRRLSDFSLMPEKKKPLIGSDTCFGITERVLSDGSIEISIDEKEIDFVLSKLKLSEIQTVAICLLHANKNPVHEKLLAEKLEIGGIKTFCSHLYQGNELERAELTVREALLFKNRKNFIEEIKRTGFDESRIVIRENAIQKTLTAKSSDNKSALTLSLLEDRILFVVKGQTYELNISGLSHFSLDDGGLAHVSSQSIGSEPGPVGFGKGLDLCVLDLLICCRSLNFEGTSKLKIDEARVLRQISPMAKQLQMTPLITAEKFLELTFDLIALEVRSLALLNDLDLSAQELSIGGQLAPLIGLDISKRLNVKKTVITDNAQWARVAAPNSRSARNE